MRLIVMLLLIISVPSIVFANMRDFIPKITDYTGSLEVDSAYESDGNSASGRSAQTRDLFLRQLLDLSAVGNIYDPKFISFSLRLATGLKEERFSTDAGSSFTTGVADEYEFRAMVLPEHPYNLELFRYRLEPLAKSGFSSESSPSVAYSSGAIFRYKEKPYFLNVHYIDSSGESPGANYSTTKYGFLGTYYKELKGARTYSFSASYDHQTIGSSNGSGTTNEAALTNSIALRVVRLSSGLTYHDSGQGSGVQLVSVSGKGTSWTERGQIYLPWNFSVDLSYGLIKESVETGGVSLPTTKITNTTNSAAFSLTHKLYESLLSIYSLGYNSLKSDEGQSKSLSHNLAFAYTKKIPGGVLRSTVSFGKSDTDSKGVQSIANETHGSVQTPGLFTLNGVDVNLATIIVWVKSPVTGELVLLQQDADYVVTPFGNSVQIQILTLPPQFALPGTYDFVASYSLNEQDARLMTQNLNYSASLELFHGMFSPYYNHTENKQTLLGGSTDFVPIEMTSNAFGFLLTWRPFTFNAEYQIIDSNINPSRGWKAEANYNNKIFFTTQLQAGVQVSSVFYPTGTSQNSTQAYTDNTWALNVGVQHGIPKRNMFLYLGSTYTREQGLGQTTTYSLNTSFVWKIGTLFITAGGSISLADSSINGIVNNRDTQYYYLTVKRKLF